MQLKWLVHSAGKIECFAFLQTFFKVHVALSIQWCRATGASEPPKALICRKFEWNSWKFGNRGFDTFVYYWVIWHSSPKKKHFWSSASVRLAEWAWKVQLSPTGRCSMVWGWANTNEGLLVGFKSLHLSFAAPPNFHCVWLFASVNR